MTELLKPTPSSEQKKVIEFPRIKNDENHNLLVSASAGAGKSTTLVNRVLYLMGLIVIEEGQKPINSDLNIDDFLIVTFTRSAAAELAEKFEHRFRDLLKKTKDKTVKEYINNQLLRLPSAIISTIDSFAVKIVDEFYSVLILENGDSFDPNYRLIADETEIKLIQDEVISDVFSVYYQNDDQDFFEVINNFASPNNISKISKIIFDLYNRAVAQSDPEKWLKSLSNQYIAANDDNYLNDILNNEYKKIENQFKKIDDFHTYFSLKVEMGIFEDEKKSLVKSINVWNERKAAFAEFKKTHIFDNWTKASNPSFTEDGIKVEIDSEYKTNINDEIKSILNKIQKDFFGLPENTRRVVNEYSKKIIDKLAEITTDFKKSFDAYKRSKNLLDFSDLSQFALQITSNSEVKRQLRERFFEVMIDEYQDVTPLQQAIFENVGEGHLFMVGDIKQSIYRFRQAEPDLFAAKREAYKKPENTNELIELSKNYRSDKNVLDTVNLIFDQIMTDSIGGVNYFSDKQDLVYGPGADDEEKVNKTEIHINYSENNDDIENAKNQDAQIAIAIERIKKLDVDDYSKIAVIARSRAILFQLNSEFSSNGIPSVMKNSGDFFKTIEIFIVLDLLRIIDNPHQDIPLAAVLRSPMVGLNEEQLVEIRFQTPEGDFFDAIKRYSKNNIDEIADKLNYFLNELLSPLQQKVTENQIDTLIWKIFELTGWYEFVGGMRFGQQRQANLRALYERARAYQKTDFVGLFRFINYVERLQENDDDLGEAKATQNKNAVQLMSIHNSKGLEFDYVFLINATGNFNKADSQGDFIVESNFKRQGGAAGIKYLDSFQNVRAKTWPYFVVESEIKTKSLSEELRMLYVALTRAKKQLFIIGNYKNDELREKKWASSDIKNTEIDGIDILSKNNYLDLIGMTLNRISSKAEIEIVPHQIVENKIDYKNDATKNNVLSDELIKKIKMEIEKKYPLNAETKQPSSITIAETRIIENKYDDNNDAPEYVNTIKLKIPESKANAISSSEIGTATHYVFEKLDIKNPDIDNVINQGIENKIFSKEVASKINVKSIEWFINTDLFESIKSANSFIRERAFTLMIDAKRVNPEIKTEDKVLLHGRIDGYFVDTKNKTVTLIDYKTNKRTPNYAEDLIENYENQIAIYKQALKNQFPEFKIKGRIIGLEGEELIDV